MSPRAAPIRLTDQRCVTRTLTLTPVLNRSWTSWEQSSTNESKIESKPMVIANGEHHNFGPKIPTT